MYKVKAVLVVPDGTSLEQIMDGSVVPQTVYAPLPVIKNTANAAFFPKVYEKNSLPSKTVPNQSMTIRELLIRFASGIPLEAGKMAIYEDADLPDVDRMDIIELQNYYKELSQQRAEAMQAAKDRQAKAEEARVEKIITARLEEKRLQEEQKVLEEYRKTKNPNDNG